MRRVADCQVMTWWEKEVRDEPWAFVEKTGCSLMPLRKRFRVGDVDGRKNERWDTTVGFKIADSKLPGSVIEAGGGSGSSGFSASSSSVSGVRPFCRRWERSKFLLKSICSNKAVSGSKRYGRDSDIVL